jgi:hypothetical protein
MSSKYKFAAGDLIRRRGLYRNAQHTYLVYGLGSIEASEAERVALRPTTGEAYSVINIKTLKRGAVFTALENRYDKVESGEPPPLKRSSHWQPQGSD